MNIVGACLLVAIGLVVFAARPKRRSNWAFAIFAASWGLHFVVNNLWFTGVLDPRTGPIISGSFAIIAAGGLFIVTRTIPARIQARDRTLWFTSLVVAFCASMVHYYLLYRVYSGPVAVGTPLEASSEHQAVLLMLDFWLSVALGTALVFWAFQLRNVPPDQPALARDHALLAAAIMFFYGFATFAHIGPILITEHPSVQHAFLWRFVWLLALTVLWLWVSASSPWSRTARNIALLGLASAFVTAVLHAGGTSGGSGTAGVARTLMVSILAYGILRHQLFGIDVKVRWGISKTTLAGIFVAVFFVASEVAQQFFGERLGGPYVGIIAAGLLVFAIAPLSRFADRVAERAIPLHGESDGPHPGLSAEGLERAFSAGVRAAMRDGVITRREERYLAELADNLGIPAARALTIRERIEDEEVAPPDS